MRLTRGCKNNPGIKERDNPDENNGTVHASSDTVQVIYLLFG